ncbi:MAG: flavodoxin-dependent (E)-4-hydroxy-3-methylbut-2-enyl-diphosphate synthase [Candidatus Cloacimonadaceae bacterium]|jgi:(E)-4-hydroxy-3-methylbut-2-enyl-diphosphate synthase|nr:flavodoxin-dependent (E)-4-hydroxy-3-methylbut-2-enyl-diphosphate synthase [Candidatus Cloacimonadota bacterium]MDY0111714.1 flavodoxin-dependent (E)-4-hydroxy-3-methylbut-2-enyl-diphosphate synthase [Candidatus Syntrophosphaera sp.]
METIKRRSTRQIKLGNVLIGGGAPISVQSMLSVPTSDISAALNQIHSLEKVGCEIIRFSVETMSDIPSIYEFKRETKIPLVADIHFDHRLALAALEAGVDGLRINPGNIGSRDKVEAVAKAAGEREVPIRIGVNSGSLPKELLAKYGLSAEAMVEAALSHIHILEDLKFYAIKVSVKASQVPLMLASYRALSKKIDYPLHLGVTEAGTLLRGSVKSALAIGILLEEGIGDTIRVSLTADPVKEVMVGKQILQNLGLRKGLQIISCPTCGRTHINLICLVEEVENSLQEYADLPLTVAVMGCVVNGPGEAREADFGIAGGRGEGLIFAKGKVIKKVPEDQLVAELIQLIKNWKDNA